MKITNNTDRKLVLVAGLASVDAGQAIETNHVDIKHPVIATWIKLGMITVEKPKVTRSKPKAATKKQEEAGE